MELSIVVPTFNESRCLSRQIAALDGLRAADSGLEVVFVDGGSTDDTPAQLASSGLPWIEAGRGRATQMNAGAAIARGRTLLFLHADTLLPPGAAELVRAAIDDGAVGGYFGVRLDSGRRLLHTVGRLITMRSRLTGVATGDQAIFVRRDAFEAVGGFSSIPLFEDIDLCRRLKRRGRLVALPAAVLTSARRWETLGAWRTITRLWALRILYYCGASPRRLARYHEPAR